MAIHSCFSARNNSCTFAGVFIASNTSPQLVPSVFAWVSVDMAGQGRILDVVVGEELCGVACCMGSGVFALKHSAIPRLVPEKKRKKKNETTTAKRYAFLFWNSTPV